MKKLAVLAGLLLAATAAYCAAPAAPAKMTHDQQMETCAKAGALIQVVLMDAKSKHIHPADSNLAAPLVKNAVWVRIFKRAETLMSEGRSPEEIGQLMADNCAVGMEHQ